MTAARGLSFGELFALHGVLDEERRPLGEHRAPSPLAGAAPTEHRPCPYPGSRQHNALPMNLSALRQTTRHWDEAHAGLVALRAWCGGGARPLSLGELWRLTAAAAALPAFLLHRPGERRALDAATAVLYKACLGLKFLIEQRALAELLGGRAPCDDPADDLAEYAETSGWLVGRQEVCAAPPGMIDDILAVTVRGEASRVTSQLVSALGSPESFQAFVRASWSLWAVLVVYSTWSVRREPPVDGAALEDPPPQNRLALTLGMRRLSIAAAALDDARCAELLDGLCALAAPPEHRAALAAVRDALAGGRSPAEVEPFVARTVRDLEQRLNAALGRDAPSERALEPPPELAAYRAPSRSAG